MFHFWECKKLFDLWARKFHFQYNTYFWDGYFYFFEIGFQSGRSNFILYHLQHLTGVITIINGIIINIMTLFSLYHFHLPIHIWYGWYTFFLCHSNSNNSMFHGSSYERCKYVTLTFYLMLLSGYFEYLQNSPVRRQYRESKNGGNKKIKHTKFSE